MDVRQKIDPLWVPAGLAPERGLRWCIGRTLSDLRASAMRQKTMSLPNVHRLFQRRWSRVSEQCVPTPSDEAAERMTRLGLREIEMFYRLRHPFVRRLIDEVADVAPDAQFNPGQRVGRDRHVDP